MSGRRKVDVVKLDEKALQRLHEKLKKINAKEIEKSETKRQKDESDRGKKKPSKFQVYQPGITRLSNRQLAANFDKTTVTASKETSVGEEKGESRQNSKNNSGSKRENRRNRDSRPRQSNSGNEQGRRANSHSRCNEQPKRNQSFEEEEESEGFLARHRMRRKRGEETSGFSGDEIEKVEHDDELAWDNYGGSGLMHEAWSPQMTTETSSQEEGELSDQELYKELSFDEEKQEPKHKKVDQEEPHGEREHRAPSDEDFDEPSAATSESNKEYYRVAHSISSQSGEDRDEDEDDKSDGDEHYEEEGDDGGFGESATPRKPQLYDPNNPEQPIMVKRHSRGQRGRYYATTSGDNVYNPNMSRARMMSKVIPNQPQRRRDTRRSPMHNSPPRYYGNYYPDDAGYQDYEPHSPVSRNYRYSTAENLSEDEDTTASHSRTKRNQSRMTALHEAEQYESTLSNLLASPSFESQEYNESLSRVRNKLKILYERLIINDVEVATNENVEQKLWKNVYYQVIEILREQIRSCPEQDSTDLRDNLLLLLDQGTAFYETLLENLQHKNRFNLKEILNSASARKRHRAKAGKRSKLAILSCQRVFICLGDTARYREQANHSTDYGRARHYYLQAQTLAPKNGRPYNQLAILAVKTRHKLDAVYYYVRSLVASNPILSARESLMALFDEVRRKLEYMQHKKDEAAAEKKMADLKVNEEVKNNRARPSIDEGRRRWEEVWILPKLEGEGRQHTEKAQKQLSREEFPELQLPPQEQAKHFILLFLNIHGKLFTRIGLESFPGILCKMLKLFESTVQNPKFMTNHRLLQLSVVNLFAVLNADKLSIHGSEHDSTQNQRRALRLAFSMFAATVDQTNKIFQLGKNDPFMSDELAILLPCIKIMFDWMYANKTCWYPPHQDLTEPDLNVWESLAELCNWICNHPSTRPKVRIYSEMSDGLHEVFLPEDVQLAGFSPLGQAFSDPRYVENEVISAENKLLIQQSVRISLIKEFLEYLCGMEEPLLAFKQGKYVFIAPIRPQSWTDQSSRDESFMLPEYDMDEYSGLESEQFYPMPGESANVQQEHGELNELKKYRDSLQMKKALQDRRQSQMKSSLESEERVKLEIRPKYLVPDTNCFIDHLQLLENLFGSGKFKIATPLVVVSELEGLAMEKKSGSAHAENVHRSAKEAVSFIDNCFKKNNQRFCALTKLGTELQNLRFRSDDTQSSGNNDDFILQSTHAYAQSCAKNEDFTVNGERVVRRSVVLLTDDRNLRLKALLMQDMATKNIVDFCRWVKI